MDYASGQSHNLLNKNKSQCMYVFIIQILPAALANPLPPSQPVGGAAGRGADGCRSALQRPSAHGELGPRVYMRTIDKDFRRRNIYQDKLLDNCCVYIYIFNSASRIYIK